jgi:hypothetical protein
MGVVMERTDGLRDAMDRERKLIRATKAYVRGKMSAQEFEKIEREHRVDYRAAFLSLSERPSEASPRKRSA